MDLKKNYLNKINFISLILISIFSISQITYKTLHSLVLTFNLVSVVSNLGFPLFFMIFGVGILNLKTNWFGKVKESYKILLPSFIFWNIFLVILILFNEDFYSGFLTFCQINRFVLIFLSNILAVPILSEFIDYKKMNGIKYILILFFISSILWSLSVQFNFSLYYIDLVFFVQPFCFMVLGYYLDIKQFNMSSKKLFLISLTILLLCLFVRCLFLVKGINKADTFFMPNFKHTIPISFDPFSIIEASSIFLIIKTLKGLLNNNSILKFYLIKSFSVLLLLNICVFMLSKSAFNFNWLYLTIITTVIFIAFAGILLFLLDKIPKINKII